MTKSRSGFDVPVFAYGSSLLSSQMEDRGVTWDRERVEIARLNDHRFVFRGRSSRPEYEGGGLADLEAEIGAYVMGVLYWTDGQLEELDRAEGVFQIYPAGCRRIQVDVEPEGGPTVAPSESSSRGLSGQGNQGRNLSRVA